MSGTPRPWSIVAKNLEATVCDATGECIPMLTDIQMGWTDTSTGNYVDPEGEYYLLGEIVRAVNTFDEAKAALERIAAWSEAPHLVTLLPLIHRDAQAVLSRMEGE